VAGIVDIPNACTTLGLPIDIFGFDISPSAGAAGEIQRRDMGRCAFETGAGEGVVVDYE
jgi:formamidase